MIDIENFTAIYAPDLCGGVQLWANKARTQEFSGGQAIKGTLFAETSEGMLTLYYEVCPLYCEISVIWLIQVFWEIDQHKQ